MIPNFPLAGSVLSRKRSLAALVHERLECSLAGQSPEQSEPEWLCVDVAGYKIINVYYPPRSGGVVGQHYKTPPHFYTRHRHPPRGMTLPRTAWFWLNRFRIGVGRFRSCLHKWGMASSVACECGAKGQTVDHVVRECAIHLPPHGLYRLTVLDDETFEWLLNTCPEI